MKKTNISHYRRDTVKYTENGQYFSHNFSHDFHIILVKLADFHASKQSLATCAQVVAEYDIHWTAQNRSDNRQRLGISKQKFVDCAEQDELHLKAIVFFIDNPQYQRDASGLYQVSWQNVELARVVKKAVVGSTNIEEFFFSAALLIGPALIEHLASFSFEAVQHHSVGDLVGAKDWTSFAELLSVATLCCDWLVLRNGEFLPDNFWGNDKDMDILCQDLAPFLLAINANRKGQGIANFYVTVEDQTLDVDARFVGDDYYERTWQADMLASKSYQGVVPQLNVEHYFYSLLYHARIHKNVVKAIYVARLRQMAQVLELSFDEQVLIDDQCCALFFDGYFQRKSYQFTYPQDYACYENINRKVTQHLAHVKTMPFNAEFTWRLFKNRLFLGLCKILPRSLKDNLKRVLNK